MTFFSVPLHATKTIRQSRSVSQGYCPCTRLQIFTKPHTRPKEVVRAEKAVPETHTRRGLLQKLALLPVTYLWTRQSLAAEGDVEYLEAEDSVVGRYLELESGWRRFETLDFQLDIPASFTFVPAPQLPTPPGRGRAAPPSAIKADFKDNEGRRVTVMEYSSSQIKPTFLQVKDISQLGSVSEVASLLAPSGVTLLRQKKDVIEQPDRDTGTVAGKVKVQPQTLYRFEYKLSTGLHVASAAVARTGKVILLGATSSQGTWESEPTILPRVAGSFQLTFPS